MNSSFEKLNSDDIQQAFQESHFFLAVQPQVLLADKKTIHSVEVFIRLRHPVYGILGPHTFLPIVEALGLRAQLTKRVVELAGETWRHLNLELPGIGVAINIDVDLLTEIDFVSKIDQILKPYNIPAKKITFEIIAPPAYVFGKPLRENMMQMRLNGYRLSLNDMQVNEQISTSLKTLPIDELKVPVQIISKLRSQTKMQTVLQKIMYLSNQYGLSVVAVGLEHQSEVDWLQQRGIDLGQGYFFGKPTVADEFLTYVKTGGLERTDIQKKDVVVLAVEDDEFDQKILNDSLGKTYKLSIAKTVAEAEKIFNEIKPELVLFDAHLPDGTGVDLCKKLKANQDSHVFSAVFLSGNDDPVLRVEAYEAGAIDFLVKPCPVHELLTKIDRLSVYHQKTSALEKLNENAQSMAVDSLREVSYYGDIIQFIKNLLLCRDEHAIALELFNFMGKKSLLCAIEMRGTDSTSDFSPNATSSSPMEINVFELLKLRGRIYEFGERAIFNDKHVSILIKNMPQDSAERGRVKDYLAVIVESIEARYQDILRHRVLKTVFQQLQGLAEDLVSTIKDDQSEKSKLLDLFSLELGSSFHILHLNEDQEEYLTNIIENMLTKKEESEVGSDEVSERIQKIVHVLNEAMEKIDNPAQLRGAPEPEEPGESVELF